MIRKLLVANRAEIAVRIFRTCRRLGIATVAVYSDADRGAWHVREADEAVCIGPSPSGESYLNPDKLIAVALETGADAIHPGYGFLSENAGFARSVISAGLIWVGPPVQAITRMGPKDEAKRIAAAAGVPVLPGYDGTQQDPGTLIAAAEEIGYPLLIKAVSGGGGRGIRRVSDAASLEAELISARREAEAAFADGRVLLEKLVESPRHIEVQIFADSHGNRVHLYERDCSLQRRRQKVVEEAPAPGLPEALRQRMTSAALRIAEAVGYEGAGTVEFILDGSQPLSDGAWWFLEMNTRLQVEHPVTEMVTGIDLVEWQLIVASGGRLPLRQEEVSLSGHAIEVRICAEDPAEGFRPGGGVISSLVFPRDTAAGPVRVDAGFQAGDRVPSEYDSLLAKLIVHAPCRQQAIEAAGDALARTQVSGLASNTGFLRRCVLSPLFREGGHHVNWIGENLPALTAAPGLHREAALGAVARRLLGAPDCQDTASPWALKDGFRLNAPARRQVRLAVDGDFLTVSEMPPADLPVACPVTVLSGRRYAVTCQGDTFIIAIPEYEELADAVLGGDFIKAPMPGRLIELSAQAGHQICRGDVVAVMEAMKMEHSLRSPRDGVIGVIHAVPGQQVAEGDVLVALVPE